MWTFSSELPRLCGQVLYLALPVLAAAALHIVVLRINLLPRLKVPLDLGWGNVWTDRPGLLP